MKPQTGLYSDYGDIKGGNVDMAHESPVDDNDDRNKDLENNGVDLFCEGWIKKAETRGKAGTTAEADFN